MVGARSNVIKVTGNYEAIDWMNNLGTAEQIQYAVVHTGRH